MRAGLDARTQLGDWKNAGISAGSLSELALTLGEVVGAVEYANQSVMYADRSGGAFMRMANRTADADALQQAGRRAEVEALFREAEQMQKESQPDYPTLYSLQGFQYGDLLLASPERAAWQAAAVGEAGLAEARASLQATLQVVAQRAAQTLEWATRNRASLLDIAHDHLTLGRTALFEAILARAAQRPDAATEARAHRELDAAAAGLRRAGQQQYLPPGLLTRAWLRAFIGAHTGPDSAQADLDDAWEIADRGPMRLHMADIHLYRARLFFREAHYPWESPEADLAAARGLIERCGYGRRKDELEVAEEALRLHRAGAGARPQR
jgi:hypothetical protein